MNHNGFVVLRPIVPALIMLASLTELGVAQGRDVDLRELLQREAIASPTLRISLGSGESVQGLLRAVGDSVLFLDENRILLSSVQSVQIRSIGGDPVSDKAILGAVIGGVAGLISPLFIERSTSRDTSTQMALSVVGTAAVGAGIAALADAAVGREVTWREVWSRWQ